MAVLLATHQADLAEAVADRMIALEDGAVIAKGTPAAVLKKLGVRS